MDYSRCPICESDTKQMPGRARDNAAIVPFKCVSCGHVTLSSLAGATENTFASGSWKAVQGMSTEMLHEQSAADTARRYADLCNRIKGRRVLDFGSGNGAFLRLAYTTAANVVGVDMDQSHAARYKAAGIPFYANLDLVPDGEMYDCITLFHVLDHIANPLPVLEKLGNMLAEDGTLVVETPNADDALLSFYHCEAFANFTYYASHVFIYSTRSLDMTLRRANLDVKSISGLQRYPLSNHLYWLAKGKPGGQRAWTRLNDAVLDAAYARKLEEEGVCDTLVALCGRKTC